MHDSLNGSDTNPSGDNFSNNVIHFQDSNKHILLLPALSMLKNHNFKSNWFDSDYWKSMDVISGQSKGRHTTWFINSPIQGDPQQWVLRHYYRGGLVAKINKDKFLYTGLSNSRCYKELVILQQMQQMNLAVPKPIAARIIKSGAFYRADLLMEKIDATDLIDHLKQRSLSDKCWQSIGQSIAKFHQRGIYHADLNAHNILLDSSEKIHLIDFDRCKILKPDENWQEKNMQRLKRSFIKEKGLHDIFNFEQNDWYQLQNAYTNYKLMGSESLEKSL